MQRACAVFLSWLRTLPPKIRLIFKHVNYHSAAPDPRIPELSNELRFVFAAGASLKDDVAIT
jgi:hypothetical protein